MSDAPMGQATASTKCENVTSDKWCGWCGNTGWVVLLGTVTVHGNEYSRGSAPCKWCQLGTKRLVHAEKSGDRSWPKLETDYEMEDVDPVGQLHRPRQPRSEYVAKLQELAHRFKPTPEQVEAQRALQAPVNQAELRDAGADERTVQRAQPPSPLPGEEAAKRRAAQQIKGERSKGRRKP